jgi:cyclophilin family peptidyl-prolyl cis-trans isomerase
MLRLVVMLLIPAVAMAAGGATKVVTFQTNKGDIVLELYPDKAPKTVANIVNYVASGFYNGTIFHRVVPGFVIQGGGFTADMQQKPTEPPIPNEAANGLKNLRGSICMARLPQPHTASSQFFINLVDNPYLDHTDNTDRGFGYCVFGKVIQGMDVVDAIAKAPTGAVGPYEGVPKEPVIITKAFIGAPKGAATKPAAPESKSP